MLVPVAPVPALVPEAGDDSNHQNSSLMNEIAQQSVEKNKDLENPALPRLALIQRQSEWLRPARSRLLRKVGIARKTHILDLGAGYGVVSSELARRSNGFVVALDVNASSLYEIPGGDHISAVIGIGSDLPFKRASFDLVFSQLSFLWMDELTKTIAEIWRVLTVAGHLVAIEPDFSAMIEYPLSLSTQDLWFKSLSRAGANPRIGRILPALLDNLGFKIEVNFIESYQPASIERFILLEGLPLLPSERIELDRIAQEAEKMSKWQHISHLPFFLISATKL